MTSDPAEVSGPTDEPFDVYAEQYNELVSASLPLAGGTVEHFAKRKVDVLKRFVSEDPNAILDFGCGIGALSVALSEAFSSSRVLGLDPSAASVAIAIDAAAARRGASPTFVVGNRDSIPLDPAQFDLAVAACVFHHIAPYERSHWVRQIFSVLKPGGNLVLFEHNPFNPLTRRAVDACPMDHDAVLLSANDARALLKANGFIDTRIVHYLFLPPMVYPAMGIERLLQWLPIGGQYAVIGSRPVERE